MPWLRLDDVGYDDPLVRAVGNAAYGAHTRMGQYAQAHRTNGWVPTDKAREICSRAELRQLLTVHIGDDATLLHEPGDSCKCLEQHDWDRGRGGYWLHDHLGRNPSRAENDVHRAKARELKDKQLRYIVRTRDRDRCRYCGNAVVWADRRSPRGGVLDHVDPTIAAGADNLVVACRGCNGRKKDCTPEAAGMTLLPVPDQDPTNSGPGSDQPQNQNAEPRSTSDPQLDPQPVDTGPRASPPSTGTAPNAEVSHPHAPENAPEDATTGRTRDAMTAGTGRGGQPRRSALAEAVGNTDPAGRREQIGPATTPRNALNPSPYRKASTGNPHAQEGPP
ncbi:hypothetical protein [Lentzea sp. NPDC059081]|uniref:hypothetical protein n=1 Tax=Lentzea sp. NPDC059081 TaxID=3346719 RepID=UPI0036AF316F